MFILNFHGVGQPDRELPASETEVWVGETQFHRILAYVHSRRDIELTFDDANHTDFRIALPALQARGLKARFFLVADRIDQPGFLSRTEVLTLLDAGMKIGSHGLRHKPWAQLEKPELEAELRDSRNRLEQVLGTSITEAACPFGSYNRRVLQQLRASGYRRVFTSDGGCAKPGVWLQPRRSVCRHDTPETIQQKLAADSRLRCRLWCSLKRAVKRIR